MYNLYKAICPNINHWLNQSFTKAVAGFAPAGALLGYTTSLMLPNQGALSRRSRKTTTKSRTNWLPNWAGVRVFHLRKVQPHSYDPLCIGITSLVVRIHVPISILRVLWVYEETRLLPWISMTFSVALMLNFAFLPRKLMASHGQGFCSLCPAFVVFCQHFCSWQYKVLLTVWTVWWWRGFLLKMVITG